MECIVKYRWPGNVRELENFIERLTILVSSPVINTTDLPEKLHQMAFSDMDHAAAASGTPPLPGHSSGELGEGGVDLNQMVSSMERNMIMKALEKAGGVRSKAAQLLSLNRTTLLEKMKKMKIDTPK
jgi:DNA-binding NtrC family response regulator